MSAISGVFFKDGSPLFPNVLDGMHSALQHCGVYDREGTWQADGIGLGRHLTYNTPESQLEQGKPWQDPVSGWVIAADVRLDNRQDLFGALGLPLYLQNETPDDQLILKAALKWGASMCAQRLLGAFAFAIYDPSQRQLTLARDPIGFRPLLYYDSPQLLAFASDVRALLTLPTVPKEYDPQSFLARDLKSYAYLAEHSLYRGFIKLPPGSTLTVCMGSRSPQPRHYWCMEARPLIRYKRLDQYVEHLRALLDQAVSARLRTAYPIGTHFTSGLDSTALAVIAARQLKKSGRELAGGYLWIAPVLPGIEDFESTDKQRALAMLDKEHIPVVQVENTPDTIYYLMRNGDPLHHPLPIRAGTLATLEQAAHMGVRTMLSGFGGNELITFFGYGYLASLFVRLRWSKLLSEAHQMSVNYHRPLRDNLHREIIPVITPEFYNRWRHKGDTLHLLSLLSFYKLSLEDITPSERIVMNDLFSTIRYYSDVRQTQLSFLNWRFIDYRLENWGIYGGPYAIEHRYPLLDQRLVEFALALPDEMYFQQGWRRYLFRLSMEGILPEEIRWRIKKPAPRRNYILDEVVRQGVRRYFMEQNGWSFGEGPNFQLDYRLYRILAGLLGPYGLSRSNL